MIKIFVFIDWLIFYYTENDYFEMFCVEIIRFETVLQKKIS